jgi:MFS family permease
LSAALRRSFHSLAIPNYRRYFAGQLVSLSGNWMQVVAEMWLILNLTGSGAAVGITAALQFLPMLLFAAWGGLLADRFSKRRLLIATQALMAVPALALWGLAASGAVEPWMVFALVFARGTVNAVDNPTRQSFVTEMVGSERVVNAVGLNSALIHSARIFGPAGAGVVIATLGVATCFLLNALTFGAMIVALRAMDTRQLQPAPLAKRGRGALRATVRYVLSDPALFVPLGMMALVGTLGFNFQVILPLLARFTFDGGAAAYTGLAIAMAVGALAGSLFTGSRRRVTHRYLIAAALAFGGFAAVAALAPSLVVAAIVLVPLGAASVAFAAGANASVQLAAEPTMRGRVMALYSMVFLGSTPVGGPIAGWLSGAVSPRAALALTAAAASVAGFGAYLFLRRSDRDKRSLRRWRWRWVPAIHRVAAQAGRPDQPHGAEGRGGLDVEADPVAVLDRGDGLVASAPSEGNADGVAGSHGRDLRPDPGEPRGDQGEGSDRPEPLEGDPARALGGKARRRSRRGEHPAHRLGGPGRPAEDGAADRRYRPPAAGDDQGDVVGVLVGDHHGDRSKRRGDSGDEQDGDPQQIAEEHR